MADVDPRQTAEARWTFFTNHAHVLFCLCEAPDSRIRDLAARVGITERAVQRILRELVDGGYLVVEREGRRNRYVIDGSKPLRHPVEQPHVVADLLDFFRPPSSRRPSRRRGG